MGVEIDSQKDYNYTAKSVADAGYQKLFEEITKCGLRNWITKDEKQVPDLKHSVYPTYQRLDFTHLFDFIDKECGIDKDKFQLEENKFAIQWETFRLGQYRNIASDKVERGICVAAKLSRIPLISLIAQFLTDCEKKRNTTFFIC